MLIVFDVLLAIALAAIVAGILIPTRRGEAGRGLAVFFFFLLLFFPLIWAGGLWLGPLGVPNWGSPWAGFVVIAIFLLLIAFALATPSGPARDAERVIPEGAEHDAEVATAISFGVFFWALQESVWVNPTALAGITSRPPR